MTVLEANGDFDAGDVWAARTLGRETGSRALLPRGPPGGYRRPLEALTKVIAGEAPARFSTPTIRGSWARRALMHRAVRAIDWPL